MAVNKNFVVKNGLEVNENLIVANATDGFVGVGTSTPNEVLHVFGGIGATDVRVTGISSFIQNVYVGASGTTFSVVDITGSLPAVGVGTDQPEYLLDVRGPVSTGYTSLYVQGDVRITGDIIADDLVFDQGNFSNVEVTGITTTNSLVVGFGASVAGISTFNRVDISGDTNITGVTTLASAGGITTTGGDLWVGSNFYVSGTQTIDSDLYIIGIATVGILTVTSDANVGSSLTVGGDVEIGGVLNSLGGITTTGGDLYVSGLVGTGLSVVGVSTFNTDVSVLGDLSVSGDLNVTGDISYDEVTGRNLNITGIATIGNLGVTSTTTTQDLKVSAGATVDGASTLTGHVSLGATVGAAGSIYFPDSKGINFGDAAEGDLTIIHDGTGSYVRNNTGNLYIESKYAQTAIQIVPDEGTDLRYAGSRKIITTNTGVVVTGIATADYFFGDGSNLTGVAASLSASIGVGSEGTPIGTGVTFINLASSSGSGVWNLTPVSSGIMTATVTPGVSLGLAIALGG